MIENRSKIKKDENVIGWIWELIQIPKKMNLMGKIMDCYIIF